MTALRALPWVHEAELRLREEGHVLTGEAFLVVHSTEGLPAKLEEAQRVARAVSWRVYDVVVTVVRP